MTKETTPKPHKNIRGAEYYAKCIEEQKEQKEQTPLTRLRDFIYWAIEEGKCNSVYDFEKQCGLAKRYISNSIGNGKGNMTTEVLAKIIRVYPMLNLAWICTGEGDMFVVPNNIDYKKAYDGAMMQIEALNSIINKK